MNSKILTFATLVTNVDGPWILTYRSLWQFNQCKFDQFMNLKKKGNETNFLEFTLWPLDFIKLYYDPKNF